MNMKTSKWRYFKCKH